MLRLNLFGPYHIVLSSRLMRVLMLCFSIGMLSIAMACDKDEDIPPTGKIFGQVLHHDDPILGATVYIKYNATEFPGTSPSDYDDMVIAGEIDATYEFNDLPKGTYYLYGIGEDTDCPCTVFGGIPVVLNSNTDIQETVVPVTE